MKKYTKGQVIKTAVIALGEVHGHAHVFTATGDSQLTAAEDFEELSERMAMQITGGDTDGGAIITHEEHDALVFPVKAGEKRVFVSNTSFEFDPLSEAIRKARD